MRRVLGVVGLLGVAAILGAVVRAQEAAHSSKKLAFDEAPASWKARPAEKKGYLCDFDLPGDARVNVLRYAASWEELRGKLAHHWKAKDGSAIDPAKLSVDARDYRGIPVHISAVVGTYVPKEGPEKEDWELVVVHLDAPGGAWSAWLMGPRKAVEEHRASYLKWLESARLVDAEEAAWIREVRFVHGAPAHGVPGPWALTAYRIGADALARLGINRSQAWEITVTHRAPKKVQYTCMLDGLLAATGASPGKMNLVHEEVASEDALETVIVHKPTKRTLVYKLTKEHRDRIRPVEYAEFPGAAKDLEARKPEELFTVTESK